MLLITSTYSLNIMYIINIVLINIVLRNRAMRSINIFIKSHWSWKANSTVLVATLLLPGAWKPFSSENRESCFYHALGHWKPVYAKIGSFDFAHAFYFWSNNFLAATKYSISIKVLSTRISLQCFLVSGRNDPIPGFLLSPDFSLSENYSTWDHFQSSLFYILEQH